MAALISFLSIAPFVMVSKSRPPEDTPVTNIEPSPTPAEFAKVEQPETPRASEEKFQTIPDCFSHIDFTNRSYGRYKFSWGKNVDLTLKDGHW